MEVGYRIRCRRRGDGQSGMSTRDRRSPRAAFPRRLCVRRTVVPIRDPERRPRCTLDRSAGGPANTAPRIPAFRSSAQQAGRIEASRGEGMRRRRAASLQATRFRTRNRSPAELTAGDGGTPSTFTLAAALRNRSASHDNCRPLGTSLLKECQPRCRGSALNQTPRTGFRGVIETSGMRRIWIQIPAEF